MGMTNIRIMNNKSNQRIYEIIKILNSDRSKLFKKEKRILVYLIKIGCLYTNIF